MDNPVVFKGEGVMSLNEDLDILQIRKEGDSLALTISDPYNEKKSLLTREETEALRNFLTEILEGE